MNDSESIYNLISERAYWEFNDLLDYIWKSDNLVDRELELEAKKARGYFPDDKKLLMQRWTLESRKIGSVFPYHIAVGNLFSSISLFETYVLQIALELEKESKESLAAIPGTGVNRQFKFFRTLGINFNQIPLHSQIIAALKIRNCLIHSSGLLEWTKGRQELERIKKSGTYLSSDHKSKKKTTGGSFDEISIADSEYGRKLIINNTYSWVLTSYLRDYLAALCDLAIQTDNGTTNGS